MMDPIFPPKDSMYHRLNPLCMMLWSLSVIIAALVFDNPVYLTLLFTATVLVAIYAKVFRGWMSYMKYCIWLCMLIMLLNPFFSHHGTHILYVFPFNVPLIGRPEISLEAIAYGAGMSLRLLTIMSAFASLLYTVNPDDLLDSLTRFRLFPKSTYVTSLAFRFMPALIRDSDTLTEVQESRGIRLNSGNMIQRVKARIPVIFPLLSNSLDRAVQVSEAMESRAFGCNSKRTFYKNPAIGGLEYTILFLSVLTVLAAACIRYVGFGSYNYYPSLEPITFTFEEIPYIIVFTILVFSIIPLAQINSRGLR